MAIHNPQSRLNPLLFLTIMAFLLPSSLWAQGKDSDFDFDDADFEEEFAFEAEEADSFELSDKESSDSESETVDDFSDEDFGEMEFGENELDEFENENLDDEFAEFDKNESEQEVSKELELEPLDPVENPDEFVFDPVPTEELPKVEASEPEEFEEPVFAEPSFEEEEPVFASESPSIEVGPDLDYESKLYNIYVNYHSQQMTEEEWAALLAGRDSELYIIQSRDTLWDISETLFADGNYWPKIWSINSRITNPHLISEGNRIHFVLGNESVGPSFTITEEGESEVDMDSSVVGEQIVTQEEVEEQAPSAIDDLDEAPVSIPPPRVMSRPVVLQLPPSIPQWQDSSRRGQYDELGVDYGRRPILDLKEEALLSNYVVSESEHKGIGYVKEIEGGLQSAQLHQFLFVFIEKGQGRVGDEFLTSRLAGELKSNNQMEIVEPTYRISVEGTVRLEELVESDDDDSDNFDLFRARVTKLLNPITVGSPLRREFFKKISLSTDGQPSGVRAQVIGGEFDRQRDLFGLHQLVFIDKGVSDGVQEGQILEVRANERTRNEESVVKSANRLVGRVRVVDVKDKVSTGVVVNSWDDIKAGDFTGGNTVAEISQISGPEFDVQPLEGEGTTDFEESEDFEDFDEIEDFEF